MTITDYIGQQIVCPCGRTHTTSLKKVLVSPGASGALAQTLRELGHDRVFWIADENTWPILGEKLAAQLTEGGILSSGVVLPGRVQADEDGIGRVLMHLDRDADALVAIGSGTINDISKFVSHRLHIPYAIAATAPSMDGFASNVAAMTTDRMKTTYPAHIPEAILADLDVLAAAPMEMIAAGVGDILGKYTALSDWQLGKIITGEYHCGAIAAMMREAVARVEQSLPGLQERRPEAFAGLTEALILSGVAMGFAGNSRPASGSEHHLSHFWEMRFLAEGRTPALHGAKVGVGTVLSIRMAKKLLETQPDFEKAAAFAESFDTARWESQVRAGYGPAAEGVLALEKETGKNSPASHAARLAVIREKWDELAAVFAQLPQADRVAAELQALGGPSRPADLGIEPALTEEAILLAKELRDRYTILQLLWDLGLLEEYAAEFAGKEGSHAAV